MTERELLKLAAKAGGILNESRSENEAYFDGVLKTWDPRNDDGDALRLAVKLQLEIYIDHRGVAVRTHCGLKVLESGCDAAATRLAIFRAAAEIGKGMA